MVLDQQTSLLKSTCRITGANRTFLGLESKIRSNSTFKLLYFVGVKKAHDIGHCFLNPSSSSNAIMCSCVKHVVWVAFVALTRFEVNCSVVLARCSRRALPVYRHGGWR